MANSKTFDLFNGKTGEAISAKTLNTLSVSYITNPYKIYQKMMGYINEAADYEPYKDSDLNPEKISMKTVHLAIPEYTSPTQWRYIYWAIVDGKMSGIRVVITRIRE
jgi:filamentous hemagglutinin